MTERVAVGKIFDAHGVRGAVKVWPLTDLPERFNRLERVFLCRGNELLREATVTYASVGSRFVRLQFKEIRDRELALELKGATIEIPEGEVIELPEGRWFHHQILGLETYDREGEFLGVVDGIMETGSNEVFVVEGKKTWMVPAIDQALVEVDLKAGRLTVDRDWIVD